MMIMVSMYGEHVWLESMYGEHVWLVSMYGERVASKTSSLSPLVVLPLLTVKIESN